MKDDTFLISRLIEGNEEAYHYLFSQHYEAMCHFAMTFINNRAEAEDIAFGIICDLYEHRAELTIHSSLRNYLMFAVRNKCLNSIRDTHKDAIIALDSESSLMGRYIIDDKHPLGNLLDKELDDIIKGALTKLSLQCRQVFGMSRFEGKRYSEIATELGISENTVKYHLKNAMKLLRTELGKYLTFLVLLINTL